MADIYLPGLLDCSRGRPECSRAVAKSQGVSNIVWRGFRGSWRLPWRLNAAPLGTPGLLGPLRAAGIIEFPKIAKLLATAVSVVSPLLPVVPDDSGGSCGAEKKEVRSSVVSGASPAPPREGETP